MRFIALVSDAYGGRGGIALYNRNFLQALCSFPDMGEVVAVPRNVTYDLEDLPPRDGYVAWAVDREGAWQQVAVWGPTSSAQALVSGTSSFATADLSSVVVTTQDGSETLVTAWHISD